MTRLVRPIFMFAILAAAAACGGDDDDVGGGADARPGEDGGGGDDGGGQEADAASGSDCSDGDGAPLLEEESFFWEGPNTACGTVTLPEDAMSGRYFQILLYRIDDPGNEFLGPGMTSSEKRVHFRLDLEAGEYKFGLRVDDNGDLETGPGDLQGFFNGTLEAPLMSDGEASAVELTTARLDLDFGLGRLE